MAYLIKGISYSCSGSGFSGIYGNNINVEALPTTQMPYHRWKDPTAGSKPLEDAVILVNHELQELSSKEYHACVHSVESVRGQPRLSISYELRSDG